MVSIQHVPPALVGYPLKWVFEGFHAGEIRSSRWYIESKGNNPKHKRWNAIEPRDTSNANSLAFEPRKQDVGLRYLLEIEFGDGSILRKASWPVMRLDQYKAQLGYEWNSELENNFKQNLNEITHLHKKLVEERERLQAWRTIEKQERELETQSEELKSTMEFLDSRQIEIAKEKNKLVLDRKALHDERERLDKERKKFADDSNALEKADQANQLLKKAQEIYSTLEILQGLEIPFEAISNDHVLGWLQGIIRDQEEKRKRALFDMRSDGSSACRNCGRESNQEISSWNQICSYCSK